MFDLKFYGLLAEIIQYHNDINNYSKRFSKKFLTKKDLIENQMDIIRKYNICETDYGDLVIYMRFLIIYFAKYQLAVAEKQMKQLNKNYWCVEIIKNELV